MKRTENVGREVFSKRHYKQSKGTIDFRAFLENHKQRLSVDMIDRTSLSALKKIAERNALSRRRTFYGWAVLASCQATANDRKLCISPTPANPYHADIVLPSKKSDDLLSHAQDLARVSRWKPV